MTDLLKLGYTGTSVHQNALNVTGHNIANVDTPGYSRQQALQRTLPAFGSGEGYFGTGAMTETIRRISETFLTQQVRNDTSLAKEYETVLDYSKQIDNLLADPSSSPGAVLNDFFAAMESLNDEPDSQPLRGLVLSQAETLVNRFNLIDERYKSMSENLNTQMETDIQDINRIASSIANLNKEISKASGRTGGLPPNDLMDLREEKLRELSEYVSVKTTDVSDGTVSVFVGDGFPLVINEDSFTLDVGPGRSEQFSLDIYYVDPKEGNKLITDLVTGGELGGVLKFRDEVLTPAVNELGRLAITISETFNEQHQKGMNLNNELGGNFFRDVNEYKLMESRVTQYQGNNKSTNISLGLEITDPSALTNKDYRLQALSGGPSATFSLKDSDGNNVRFKNTSTNPDTYQSVVNLNDLKNGVIEVDGFKLTLTSAAAETVYKGDNFTLSPTRTGAEHIRKEITSGNEIAIASPIRATAASFNDGSLEVVSSSVSKVYKSSAVSPGFNPNSDAGDPNVFFDQRDGAIRAFSAGNVINLPNGIQVKFDPAGSFSSGDTTMAYEIQDPATGAVLSSGNYTLGKTQNVIPSSWGFEMQLGGMPSTGDSVLIDFNTDGFGDNTNGRSISDLQSKGILDDGKVTYQDAYSHIAEFVGMRTAEAKINAESGSAILEQSKALREGVSGVNLDEEAANLVKFQQAYNASAQLISVSQQIFSSLINAVGR